METSIIPLLSDLNPWVESAAVPSVLAGTLERGAAQPLAERMQGEGLHRFHVVLGPRRTGKTTLLYQTIRTLLATIDPLRLIYLHLDHPHLIGADLGAIVKEVIALRKATAENPVFLFLDEISYAKSWDLWLKTFFDERWPIKILATSSAASVLREGRSDSGVGRWQEHELPPFLFGEFLKLVDAQPKANAADDLLDTLVSLDGQPDENIYLRVYLQIGGFPELLTREHDAWTGSPDDMLVSEYHERTVNRYLEAQRILRDDAIERAIHKDINQLYGIDRPQLLEKLLYLLADRVAQRLEPTKLCTQLDGLSIPTFERYLGFLENAFLLFTLPNYSGNESSIQRRGRKVYFFDVAVRNAALLRGLAAFDNPSEYGHLIENAAAAHLHALARHEQTRVFHWREQDNHEVDLIYNHPSHPMAFEIASSLHHDRSGLRAFIERFPHFRGRCFMVVATRGSTVPPSADADGIGTVSLPHFLVAVSAHAIRAQRQRIKG